MAVKKSAPKKKFVKSAKGQPSSGSKPSVKKESVEKPKIIVSETPPVSVPETVQDEAVTPVPDATATTLSATPASDTSSVEAASVVVPPTSDATTSDTDATVLSATPTTESSPATVVQPDEAASPAVVSPAVTLPTMTPVSPVATTLDTLTTSAPVSVPDDMPQSHTKKILRILFIIIFLFLLIGAGFFFMQRFQKNGTQPVAVAPSPTLSPTPTVAKVDLSEFAIKVLNGSGIAGQAAKMKDTLEADGFTVVSTGNAPTRVIETSIAAKKAVPPEFLKKLISSLSISYTIASDTAALAEDTKDADVIVTVSKPTE